MITECLNCEEKKVWFIIRKSKVPKGRNIIVNLQVYTEIYYDTFCSRTVSKGISQVPSKNLQQHSAPVVHDTTFHVVLISFKVTSC
jgi:hypothetical protein